MTGFGYRKAALSLLDSPSRGNEKKMCSVNPASRFDLSRKIPVLT